MQSYHHQEHVRSANGGVFVLWVHRVEAWDAYMVRKYTLSQFLHFFYIFMWVHCVDSQIWHALRPTGLTDPVCRV